MRVFAVLAAVLSASSLSHLAAQAPAELDIFPPVIIQGEAPTTTKLVDRMATLRVPGVSIAVIHAGKIEWARGFGVASIGGADVNSNTLFQAASISKAVTAMAVLSLVQEGKIDLDKDVNQYLRTWKVPANSLTDKAKVTTRELLTHTAGMTVHGFPGYASDAPLPTLVQVLNGEKPANTPAIVVDMVPGTEWRYSGGGFVVAQLLLQDVTGEPFPAFMKEKVLGPAGMGHSTFEQPLPQRRIGEAATAYRQNGQPPCPEARTCIRRWRLRVFVRHRLIWLDTL
jgi:CubicO group peptidase (beta-lactamase class C family)